MFAVSIATSTNIEIASLGFWNVSETFAFHAWQACSEIVVYGSPVTVDDLRTLFLLGLYEFRNSPNRKAWTVTGHLVRCAFHYGLHQIESADGCSFLDPERSTAEEREELRYLWWSIYTLDTVSQPNGKEQSPCCCLFCAFNLCAQLVRSRTIVHPVDDTVANMS